MPINCLVKCLINSEQIVNNSCSNNQFMVNSWTIHEHSCFKKTALSPFIFCLFLSFPLLVFLSLCLFVSSSPFHSFPLSSSLFLSLPLFLSFFNVRPTNPANSLKTKDLRKRHFWLKFLSPGKPLRIKTLGAKFAQWFVHFPADSTLHMPPKPSLHAMPRNPTLCRLSCRICRPSHTHLTLLIIKL